jgi:signal transduction histidine kinase
MKVFLKVFFCKTLIILILNFLSTQYCIAQSFTYADTHPVNNLDSLKTWLNIHPNPTIYRLKALIQYERTIYYVNLRMDKAHLDEIEKISKILNNRTGLASYNLLKAYNSVFDENVQGTLKLFGETLLEFEKLNDPSGQFYTYLTLYSTYIKLNSVNEYKNLQSIYLEKAQQLLKKYPNVYDQSNLYLALFFTALSQKQNDLLLNSVIQLKELYKRNPCLAYLGNIVKKADDMIFPSLTENEIDNRVRSIENGKLKSNSEFAQNAYLLNIFGEYYYKRKKVSKALATFKKSIEYYKTSPIKNYELLLQAYQICRNIEQKEYKNFEEANILSDSIFKYLNLLNLQRSSFELSNFQMQYGLNKAQLESELFSKNIILSEKQKNELERSLQLQKQQALNNVLKKQLEINQKALQLTKSSLDNAKLKASTIKIKNEIFYLYAILGLLAILLAMFAYFYKKRLNSNKELNQLINDREKLTAIIAHDLRSPITNLMTISTSIKYLLKNNRKEDLKIVLDSLENQANNTSLLINNLFEWGKMKSFTQKEDYQIVDVGALIQDIAEQYRPIIEAKGIGLYLKIPEQITVMTNLKALSIILRNLIDNAQKFTSKGGLISILIEKNINGNILNIYIKDTGKGFSDEKLYCAKKIFANKANLETGLEGLGLILISEFARKISCVVKLESKIGEGTSFILTI